MVVWDGLELYEIVFKDGTSLHPIRTWVESLVVGVVM